MEGTAPAPFAAGGLRLSTGIAAATWALVAVVLAGGAGLLAAANPRLAFTIFICAAAALAVHFAPFAVLLVLLVFVAHPSPLADMLLFATVVGGGPVVARRLVRTPGRVFLVPLALFLLLALNGLQWTNNDPLVERPKSLVVPVLLHTYTRSAWIAFAIALVMIAVLGYRSLLAVAALTLVLAIVGFPGAVHSVQQRFGDLTAQNQANADNSLAWRRGQWRAMS